MWRAGWGLSAIAKRLLIGSLYGLGRCADGKSSRRSVVVARGGVVLVYSVCDWWAAGSGSDGLQGEAGDEEQSDAKTAIGRLACGDEASLSVGGSMDSWSAWRSKQEAAACCLLFVVCLLNWQRQLAGPQLTAGGSEELQPHDLALRGARPPTRCLRYPRHFPRPRCNHRD